ncbi:protein FAM136A [Agrilus planipennis]|uniref:Protein FAM136A n=1 Tax=Agrilus planipennis TaxID=224129 RepID=A0A1W4X7J8_AGRPL|nr:protein FAM136A [Agrilus planipennis]XP_025833466.1 protein FAM136A [Agrilus planipennis]
MVEQQRQRVEQEMSNLVNEIDRDYLRKMQADMHRCAIKCCENDSYSVEKVQRCVETCSLPLQNAQNYVQKELEQLQSRLQRCVMDCNDEIKDKMGPNPSDSEIEKFTNMFEKCAVKCVDKHLNIIPQTTKAIKTVLTKGMEKRS